MGCRAFDTVPGGLRGPHHRALIPSPQQGWSCIEADPAGAVYPLEPAINAQPFGFRLRFGLLLLDAFFPPFGLALPDPLICGALLPLPRASLAAALASLLSLAAMRSVARNAW